MLEIVGQCLWLEVQEMEQLEVAALDQRKGNRTLKSGDVLKHTGSGTS